MLKKIYIDEWRGVRVLVRGIGTDIVEIARIEKAIKKNLSGFERRIFTEAEWEYCWNKKNPIPSLAARFAAKEAVFKALGIGLGACKWKDVEVTVAKSGKPQINLMGKAAAIASSQFISILNISLSHSENYAIAFVVAE
ncbi:MAG: holo-[acyl-carrier protein] synthase [Clostridia bacterium]|jgi:holo-[acyl-carrier protein] synthase|nr:holo-acyl-carrier-protein synthase [Clostridiales bacterium]MDK2984774.1 holo-[acyl-carrier protein] synthase [Clostridia bacterium]